MLTLLDWFGGWSNLANNAVLCPESVEYIQTNFGDSSPTMREFLDIWEDESIALHPDIPESERRFWIKIVNNRLLYEPDYVINGGDCVWTDEYRVMRGATLFEGNLQECIDYVNNVDWLTYRKFNEFDEEVSANTTSWSVINSAWGTSYGTDISHLANLDDFIIKRRIYDSVETDPFIEHWIDVDFTPNYTLDATVSS